MVWQTDKTIVFSETIVVYDIKVVKCSYLNETRTYINIKGQGQSLTLVQGHSDSTFSNFFSLETTKSIKAKFFMEPSWDRGTKFCSNDLGHMTKVAAIPIYGKNL